MKISERKPELAFERKTPIHRLSREPGKATPLEKPDSWASVPCRSSALQMVVDKSGAIESGLNELQIRFAAYLAVPIRLRPDRKKLADELGITIRTLDNWRNNPNVISLSLRLAKLYLTRCVPEVYDALTNRAIAYSDRSAEIILRALGVIESPGITVNTTTNKLVITKDDLDDILGSLRNLEKPEKEEPVILLPQNCASC